MFASSGGSDSESRTEVHLAAATHSSKKCDVFLVCMRKTITVNTGVNNTIKSLMNDSVFKEATRRLASILCNIMENSIGWSSQGKGAVGFYFLLYSRTTVCVVACSKERKKTQVVPGSSMSVEHWYQFILCEV